MSDEGAKATMEAAQKTAEHIHKVMGDYIDAQPLDEKNKIAAALTALNTLYRAVTEGTTSHTEHPQIIELAVSLFETLVAPAMSELYQARDAARKAKKK